MTDALRTERLSKSFGGFRANDAISISFPVGVRHAVIGPNGAGKTTFVNLLTGVYPPSAGDIFLFDENITRLAPDKRVKRGMTRTFQVNRLLPGLTALESVLLAILERDGNARRWRTTVASHRDEAREAWEILERLDLGSVANTTTRVLPYGKQRLLEIALALATRPKVLILDEPAAGIPAGESAAVLESIAALPGDVTVLLIEHDMDVVFRFAERITVLAEGRAVAEGPPDAIAADPLVREIYLGDFQGG